MSKIVGINSRDYVNKAADDKVKIKKHKVLAPIQKDTAVVSDMRSAFKDAVAANAAVLEEKPIKVKKNSDTDDGTTSGSDDGVPQKEFLYKVHVEDVCESTESVDCKTDSCFDDRQRMLDGLMSEVIQSSCDRGLGE